MRTVRIRAVATFVGLLGICGTNAIADGKAPCATLPLSVVNVPNAEVQDLICDGADRAIEILSGCGIGPRESLEMHVRKEVRHPLGDELLAFFDTSNERILISEIEVMASLVQGTPYAQLPLREFFQSVVSHEVVHAVLHHHYRRRPPNRATVEYPAYAIQIASLSIPARDLFLQTVRKRGDIANARLNDIILAADPFLFAARAYAHFDAFPGGCQHIRAIIRGRPTFIPHLQ